MSKELTVVQDVVRTGETIDALEQLIDKLPEVATADLVTGFQMANTYGKRITKFVDAAKKELVDNKAQTGRFLTEGEEDAKGHRYLTGSDGAELKAEKRVYSKFDQVKALVLVRDLGLEDEATDKQFLCTDPALAVRMLTQMAAGTLTEKEMVVLAGELLALFATEVTVSEQKVEALVTLGKIDVKDVAQLMDTKIQYAVKASKRKK